MEVQGLGFRVIGNVAISERLLCGSTIILSQYLTAYTFVNLCFTILVKDMMSKHDIPITKWERRILDSFQYTF